MSNLWAKHPFQHLLEFDLWKKSSTDKGQIQKSVFFHTFFTEEQILRNLCEFVI